MKRCPIDAWEVFLDLARDVEDPGGKALWVVCAAKATPVPLSFPPIDNCFGSLGRLAFCRAAGFVKPQFEKRNGRVEIVFKTLKGEVKTKET